jgi:hypothetical protein
MQAVIAMQAAIALPAVILNSFSRSIEQRSSMTLAANTCAIQAHPLSITKSHTYTM